MSYAPAVAPGVSRVTVVTPFFNTPWVFHETARCVLGQSLQEWEWVIVNDGSADAAALQMLEGYRRIDPRVRVVDHPENRGLSAARNTGFREARADLVFQLDSDDLIEPTTLEKCLWFLATHPEYAFVKGYSVGFGAQEYLWTRGFHDGEAMLDENLVTATTMVRRSVHAEVGGYDEAIRAGLEDWDFWLRCAGRGHWGATLPEFLDWYRRRDRQWESWENLSAQDRLGNFRQAMRRAYPALYAGGFPSIAPQWPRAFDTVPAEPAAHNLLAKPAGTRRILMILPWLTMGGADKFNLAVLRQLVQRGWEPTIATTLGGDHSWMPEFSRHTPDIFALPHFLRPRDFPVFLRALIDSRRPDVVMISNSELGYLLLPYLRAMCPEPAYVDYCHMEEEYWKNGGYPRYAAGSQSQLDLNIVSSRHLREWMRSRGADPARIEVCHTCEDTQHWCPCAPARSEFRLRHGIPEDRAVLLYAGRILGQKQPQVFAATVRELAGRGLEFTAIVAGTGPDLPWLERFVADNGLGDLVRFLGAVPADAMPTVMAASDIFFLPSLWEGIALSIYEAMSVGLAVVGADVGGQRELVTPDCGVLRPRADEEAESRAYADALARLIQNPTERRLMGERARRRVQEHFKLSDMGDRMVELFAAAARWKARSPRVPGDVPTAYETATRAVEYMRAFSLTESLWSEREALRHSVRALEQQHNGHHPPAADPHLLAQRIIEENVRYRFADRVNSMLKGLGLHRTIKTITLRAMKRQPRR